MVSSAPALTFDPTAISAGVVNVGSSTALATYHVINASQSYATVENHSICMVPSANSDEMDTESWLFISNATGSGYTNSSNETPCGTIAQGASEVETWKIVVPASPATSGTVYLKIRSRYQYTG